MVKNLSIEQNGGGFDNGLEEIIGRHGCRGDWVAGGERRVASASAGVGEG